jgi:hypothetical protein
MVDYNILEATRTIINNILKSSSENDILLSKINKGFDMVMNKMCIIIKNDQESEIIDNIASRELLKEYNKIKNDNGEEEKIDKFEDYLSDKQRTDTANKFINGMLDYFKHHLHLEIVSDDIIDDYVKDFYPPSLLLLSEKESYISVNINNIEEYSKDIYSRLSVLTIKRNLNLFIPYIDINTLKIECIHIHRSDSESDIFDKLKRVFIDDYKGKVPFRVCEIFYNINLYNNNDKEGDNIGED